MVKVKMRWFLGRWPKLLLCSSGLVVLLFLSGCTEKSLPHQDIVFNLGMEDLGKRAKLGVINADGSNLEYIEFRQSREAYPNMPVWSPDRTRFVYLTDCGMGGYSGNIAVVDLQSSKARQICSFRQMVPGTAHGPVRWTPDGKYLLVVPGGRGIELLDPRTCKTEQVLVPWPSGEKEGVRYPDLSVQNELVYVFTSRYCTNTDCSYITVKNLVTAKVRTLGQGLYPSWSPDGEWVVFTREDGLYVVQRDGSQERKLLDITDWWNVEGPHWGPPRATWSPDGKWVIYHRVIQDGAKHSPRIYKLDASTGRETCLGDFLGLNPHWHWDVRSIEGTQ